ncbi:MAG: IS982 family transposase [Lachnospiraceae bacterium]|nr:IS982 family transposase [Lachnospiraceae bacterium]
MLKFQDDYTTLIATFEDFILLVFAMIDDLNKQFVPASVSQRRNVSTAKMSASEIITLSICGEVISIDSEKAWYSFVKLPVCKFGRARFCHSFRIDGANYGKCPSKKETYYGFKVHALITLEGYITAFKITPASIDDRESLRHLAENHLGLVILGDKGYTGERLLEDRRSKGICLMSLKLSSYKTNLPKAVRQLIFRFRRRVETVFSQLSEQMNAEKVLAKSFHGLCTLLQNKILGHNPCMAFNSIFHEACDIGKIKQLVF